MRTKKRKPSNRTIDLRVEARIRAEHLRRDKAKLARQLWGAVGTPEKVDEELARLREISYTLEHQRDDALKELNDRENLEMYLGRFSQAVHIIKETAAAILVIGANLRAATRKIKPPMKKKRA